MPRPRGTGSIYLQKGSSVWWVKYYRNGKSYRESTHEKDEGKAKTFLKRRLAEIITGSFSGPRAERIRVDELAEDFLRDYRINGRKSLPDAEARWRLHIKPFFGNLRAVEVSSDLVSRYVDARQLLLLAWLNPCRPSATGLVSSANLRPTGNSFKPCSS
jgi:hypothetical protein